MGTILENGTIVSYKGPISDGAVAFEDDKIVGIGHTHDVAGRFPDFDRKDVRHCIVIPGLVNAHTHVAMCIFRGAAEDLPLHDWLEKRIWPMESKSTPKDIEIGALVGAYEALLSGTTTLNSMYFYSEEGSEANAFANAGIRAVVGHGFFERTWQEGLKLTLAMAKRWHGAENGRIRVSVSPHAPYSTGPRAYQEAHRLMLQLNDELGEKGRVLLHTHVAESPGEARLVRDNFKVDFEGGVVNYLEELDVLSQNMIASHAIHLNDEEISLLKKNEVGIALNPVSNLKVGMGVAPYVRLRGAGLDIGLATDSATSNNTLDMFETLKLFPLLQKGLSGDATIVPASEAFQTATIGGARALKWDDQIGLIKEGYKADIVVLNTRNMHSMPLYDIYSHLVYSARSADVLHVFVDGKQLVKGGRIIGLDYEAFFEKVNETRDSILKKVGNI